MRDEQARGDDHVRPDHRLEARRDEREHDDLRDHAGGDDPRVARLPPRQVIADEDVGEREEPDREREGRKDAPAGGKVRAEGRRHEARAGRFVEQRQQPAERGRREQGPPQDVLGLLPSSLAGCRAREEDSENRRR